VITPTGLDPALVRGGVDGGRVRAALGLGEAFVVGWVGSFRKFHALDVGVDALARVPGATFLLVGDGPERAPIEARARARGVRVVCTGTVPHDDVPEYLAAMDAALLLADKGGPFHYSPLKLAEYLAAGLPVVAPRAGDLPAQLRDEIDALLVPPGDVAALAAAVRRLRDDAPLRARLASGAHAAAGLRTWDASVDRLLAALPPR
jgi:glycosyltransferase involved in cell wall biosynthesis